MPPLKNAKHEKFALELVRGCNQTEAATNAGYTPSRACKTGYDLMLRPDVLERIKELQIELINEVIADVTERKKILTRIYRSEPQGGRDAVIKAGHIIAAIGEHNRMEGVGSQGADVQVFVPIQFVRAKRRAYQDD